MIQSETPMDSNFGGEGVRHATNNINGLGGYFSPYPQPYPRIDVKSVQRELAAWYGRFYFTTPELRAAYEDVMHGLDVYRLNKQMMSPALMRGLAESVAKLAAAHDGSVLGH